MNLATLQAMLPNFAIPVGLIALFYFMVLGPQQRKAKEHKALIAAVKRGDRVVTAGGILGTVAKVRDGVGEVEVDIAPNVRVVVLRDTLTNVVLPVAANDSKAA